MIIIYPVTITVNSEASLSYQQHTRFSSWVFIFLMCYCLRDAVQLKIIEFRAKCKILNHVILKLLIVYSEKNCFIHSIKKRPKMICPFLKLSQNTAKRKWKNLNFCWEESWIISLHEHTLQPWSLKTPNLDSSRIFNCRPNLFFYIKLLNSHACLRELSHRVPNQNFHWLCLPLKYQLILGNRKPLQFFGAVPFEVIQP